jgi:putative flippase GtrA
MIHAHKLSKYIITGGATFVVEYGLFLVFAYIFAFEAWVAQVCSYILALVINFLLLRNWTFGHNNKTRMTHHFMKYGILVAFNLPITAFIIYELVRGGVAPFLAKLIVVALVALWNFIIYDKLIFRDAKPRSH